MVQAVQNTRPKQSPPSGGDGAYDMQGPGIDISTLMGNIMMPPPPMNTTTPVLERQPPIEDDDDDNISDIVLEEALLEDDDEQEDVKEVSFQEKSQPKKRGRKKKTEINL